jgi:hypothetical protein
MILRSTLIASLLLLSTPAFSERSLLLHARQTSGFTRMEDAFENLCTLDTAGHLEGTLKHGRTESGGWNEEKAIEISLSAREIEELLILVRDSRNGPFRDEPAICDTGDLIIRAGSGKNSFPVIEIRDCEKGILNLNPSAKKIEEWLRHQCRWTS